MTPTEAEQALMRATGMKDYIEELRAANAALVEACEFAMRRLEVAYHGDEEEREEARREDAEKAAEHAAWADRVLADHPEYQRFKAALALAKKP